MANIFNSSSTGGGNNFTNLTVQNLVAENAAIDNINVDGSAVFDTIQPHSIAIHNLNPGDVLYIASPHDVNGLTIGPANNVMTSTGSIPAWTNSLTINSVTSNQLQIPGTSNGDLLVMNGSGVAQRLAVGAAGT